MVSYSLFFFDIIVGPGANQFTSFSTEIGQMRSLLTLDVGEWNTM